MSHPQSSFLARWNAVWRENSDRPAIWTADGNVALTFLQLETASESWVEKLADLPARSAVGLQLQNDPSWPAILLGLWKKDAVVLPLDVSLPLDSTEQILTAASARAIIRTSGIQWRNPASAASFFPATILCKITSGTTGTPRLIEFTSEQLLADSDNIIATMQLSRADINYGAIPFSHSYGFSNLISPLLSEGISLVSVADNFPLSIVAGIQKTSATILPGIPILFQTLCRLGLRLPDSIRLCLTAGAPLGAGLAQEFYSLNQRKIHSFYGASESGGICYDATEEIDLPVGFVGYPLQGVHLIHQPETKKIVVRSAAVGTGYYPEGGHEELSGGDYRPGDILEKTSRGFVIVGRDSLFINIAGKKLDPQLVQQVIERVPRVARAIVFPIPDAKRGETAIAAVETSVATAEEILTFCRQSLAPWQIPSAIWLCEEIPMTSRGKINRRDLAQTYLAQVG